VRRRARRLLCGVGLALLTAPSADAVGEPCTNLLSNGDFSSGTTGWQTSASGSGVDVYLVVSPIDDRLGNASSGAALLYNQSSGDGLTVGTFPLLADTCVGASAGDPVRVGGWIRIPQMQPTSGGARLAVEWFGGAHCTSPFLGFASTTSVAAPGDWTPVDDIVTAPPGIDSFRVGLSVTKNEAGGVFQTYFDDLFVCVPEPGANGLAASALGAIAALARRRRRG
jgi:hypothetical protein